MICKLAAWGDDREEALARMRRALDEFTISGELVTNLDFHRWIVRHPRFRSGDFDTGFIGQEYKAQAETQNHDSARLAAILGAAFIASRETNYANSSVHAAAPPAPVSAWKTLGRMETLRR
jgi:acetyl/propionyl-CoA carboxylase alpha subunit